MNIFLKCGLMAVFLVFAALIQTGILAHAAIMGIVPDLVFITFFTLIFFEKSHHYYGGIFFTLMAGFLVDVNSTRPFGVAFVIFASIYAATKMAIHFLKESRHQFPVFYFIPMFLIAWILYNSLFALSANFQQAPFLLNQSTIISIVYNAIIALVAFYLYPAKAPKQLKLL